MHLAFDREKEERFAGPEAGGLDWYIVQNPIIPGAIINSIYKWGYLYLYIYRVQPSMILVELSIKGDGNPQMHIGAIRVATENSPIKWW